MNVERAIAEAHLRVPARLARIGVQSLRYGLASAMALGCDLAVYAVALSLAVLPAIAGSLGYLTGLFAHYLLSSGWVFPDGSGSRRALPTFFKFAATGLLGLGLTAAVIGALTAPGITGPFEAKAVAVAVSYMAVFLVRRRYVFSAAVLRDAHHRRFPVK